MYISRRNLLRRLGTGAVVGAAAPALRGWPLARATEEALWGNSVPVPQPPDGATAADPILLYRNENPYGPSEKVLGVLRESAAIGNRYPRTEYDTLTDKLAALHKVKHEHTVLGCGRFSGVRQKTRASRACFSRARQTRARRRPRSRRRSSEQALRT